MRLELALAASVAAAMVLTVWASGNGNEERPDDVSEIHGGSAAVGVASPQSCQSWTVRISNESGQSGEDGGKRHEGTRGDNAPVSERLLSGFAGKAYSPPGTWLSREAALIQSPECRSRPLGLEAVYPQGIDGGGQVDRAVQAVTSALLADAMEAGEKLASSGKLCDYPGPLKVLYRGRPYRSSPSPGSLSSVLFIAETYRGAGRGSVWYGTLNLLPDGSELTVGMLFPDPDSSLDKLWNATYGGFCENGNPMAPAFYGSQRCGAGDPPRPAKFAPASASLDSVGHALVTSLGLTLILAPEEAWNWPDGPAWLDIPKEKMVEMGADPGIWK
ncbi:MAG: hypothetical protein LBQ79_14045 [Deltaproteobacteria bacterium]|nr:hypothetical protein [Deltaproteobacteria bacterium]